MICYLQPKRIHRCDKHCPRGMRISLSRRGKVTPPTYRPIQSRAGDPRSQSAASKSAHYGSSSSPLLELHFHITVSPAMRVTCATSHRYKHMQHRYCCSTSHTSSSPLPTFSIVHLSTGIRLSSRAARPATIDLCARTGCWGVGVIIIEKV